MFPENSENDHRNFIENKSLRLGRAFLFLGYNILNAEEHTMQSIHGLTALTDIIF